MDSILTYCEMKARKSPKLTQELAPCKSLASENAVPTTRLSPITSLSILIYHLLRI